MNHQTRSAGSAFESENLLWCAEGKTSQSRIPQPSSSNTVQDAWVAVERSKLCAVKLNMNLLIGILVFVFHWGILFALQPLSILISSPVKGFNTGRVDFRLDIIRIENAMLRLIVRRHHCTIALLRHIFFATNWSSGVKINSLRQATLMQGSRRIQIWTSWSAVFWTSFDRPSMHEKT